MAMQRWIPGEALPSTGGIENLCHHRHVSGPHGWCSRSRRCEVAGRTGGADVGPPREVRDRLCQTARLIMKSERAKGGGGARVVRVWR